MGTRLGGLLVEGGRPRDHNDDGVGAVLIVEDEVMIALALEAMLEDLGFKNICIAHTMNEAHALAQQHALGLAILDVNVGDELIYPLADDLRRRGVPLAFSTGRAAEDFPPDWRAQPLIAKPAEATKLTAAINTLGFRWTGRGWERT